MDETTAQQMIDAMRDLRERQQQMEAELGAARAAGARGERPNGRDAGFREDPPPPPPREEGEQRRGAMGVDTRLLGKPPDFHGEHERWRDWAVVFRGYAGAAVPGLGELMPWAAAHVSPVLNATLAGCC